MTQVPVYANGTAERKSNDWFMGIAEVLSPASDIVTISPKCGATGHLIFSSLMSCSAEGTRILILGLVILCTQLSPLVLPGGGCGHSSLRTKTVRSRLHI